MPNDHLIQDAELYMSDREGPFNTPITDATKYERITWQNGAVIIPQPLFSTDAGRAGNANGLQTGQCLTRFPPNQIGIADRANFKTFGKLALRWAGGPIATPVTVAGVATRHSAPLMSKSAGSQLPSFNSIAVSGGASVLMPGTIVNDFSMSQSGVEDVQISFGLIASGKHRIPHLIGTQQVETITVAVTSVTAGNAKVTVTARDMGGFSPRVVTFAVANSDTAAQVAGKARTALQNDPEVSDFFIISGATDQIVATARHTATNDTTMLLTIANDTSGGVTTVNSANTTAGVYELPDLPAFNCLDSQPFLEYTDDVGLRDLSTDCFYRAWTFTGSNNHNLEAAICAGDPRQKRGDYSITTPGVGVGRYANKSVKGQTSMSLEILYLTKRRVPEWEKMCDSIQLTGVKLGARGAVLDAAGPTYEELSVVIPKAKFNVVQGDSYNGYSAFRFSLVPEHDVTTNGAKIEVVNNLDGVSPVFN